MDDKSSKFSADNITIGPLLLQNNQQQDDNTGLALIVWPIAIACGIVVVVGCSILLGFWKWRASRRKPREEDIVSLKSAASKAGWHPPAWLFELKIVLAIRALAEESAGKDEAEGDAVDDAERGNREMGDATDAAERGDGEDDEDSENWDAESGEGRLEME